MYTEITTEMLPALLVRLVKITPIFFWMPVGLSRHAKIVMIPREFFLARLYLALLNGRQIFGSYGTDFVLETSKKLNLIANRKVELLTIP